MKELKFLITLLLVLVIGLSVTFAVRLDTMEGTARDRYLNIVVAVDFTRDKVKLLAKEIHKINEADIAYKTESAETKTYNNNVFWKKLTSIQGTASYTRDRVKILDSSVGLISRNIYKHISRLEEKLDKIIGIRKKYIE